MIVARGTWPGVGGSTDGESPTVAAETDTSEPEGDVAEVEAADDEPEPEPEPDLTAGQRNAVRTAENYLSISGFSRKGLIEQLEFDGYSTEEATYGAEQAGL